MVVVVGILYEAALGSTWYRRRGEWACDLASSEVYVGTGIEDVYGSRRHIEGLGQAIDEVSRTSDHVTYYSIIREPDLPRGAC